MPLLQSTIPLILFLLPAPITSSFFITVGSNKQHFEDAPNTFVPIGLNLCRSAGEEGKSDPAEYYGTARRAISSRPSQ